MARIERNVLLPCRRAALCAAVAGIAWSASLPAQRTEAVQRTARDSAVAKRVGGCYELVEGAWQSDTEMAEIARLPTDPIRFELTLTPALEWLPLSNAEHLLYFAVRMDSIAGWGTQLFTTWTRNSGSGAEPQILVSRPLPMAGLDLTLSPRGNDLVGVITAFTDAVPRSGRSEASHAVTARRIRCRSTQR